VNHLKENMQKIPSNSFDRQPVVSVLKKNIKERSKTLATTPEHHQKGKLFQFINPFYIQLTLIRFNTTKKK
jgi:hypothetical protein